jgi:P27 family predicted phage terminase small subunit
LKEGRAVPVEVKEARGTVNVTRERERQEIRPESIDADSIPMPPDELGERGRELWMRLAMQLAGVGILFPSVLEYLEAYCRALESRERAWEEIKDGAFYEYDDKGHRRISAAYKIYNEQVSLMVLLGAKLGLSPIDKTKVSQTIAGGKNAGKNDIKRIGVNG